jgi:transposase
VESLPWATGKDHQTTTLKVFLATWARRLSWKQVAEIFQTSWDSVFRAVEYAVQYGLAHRSLEGIERIGIDEIQVFRYHKYLTLVYQIDPQNRRLLWTGMERKAKTLLQFFRDFGKDRTARLKFICTDMWRAYLSVIRKKAPQALNVLDRFHIMKKFNMSIDQVRRQEVRKLKESGGKNVLIRSRWLLLKNKVNLDNDQVVRMAELLKTNLNSVRAYLMREDFQRFWSYKSATWAEKFLNDWNRRTMRCKIQPMKGVVRMLREFQPLILNWFRANGTLSAGIIEGLNLKAKLTMRKAYGFRSPQNLQIALYHTLGNLPEPKLTHKFC